MKIVLASAIVSGFITTAIGQQQSPFQPPATSPPQLSPPTAGQTTIPANQGATDPTGTAGTGVVPSPIGDMPANTTGRVLFGQDANAQAGSAIGAGSAPLFLTITPMTVTDANGQLLGTMQQISLSPPGTINFGLLNMGGRMVPVPWQFVSASTAGRAGLGVNVDRAVLQSAPAVTINQLPLLAQEDVQGRILSHFGAQIPAQPMVAGANTASGGLGSGAVTTTGGAMSSVPGTVTNQGRLPNNMATNQAVNTTGGLLSPSGQTNGIQDPYRGPGSLNPNRPPVPSPIPPNPVGQPGQPGQQQR